MKLPKIIALSWLLSTVLATITIIFVMMFSRETTLHGVRGFDFDLIIEAQKSFSDTNYAKEFTNVTNKLGYGIGSQKETIFFPIALITQDSCVENGTKNQKICSKISDLNDLNDLLKHATKRGYGGRTIYDTEKGTYFYHALNHGKKVIIGKAGKYVSYAKDRTFLSQLNMMQQFLIDEAPNYISSKYGANGTYAGWSRLLNKTKEVVSVFLIFSLIIATLFWLLIRYNQTRHELKTAKLKKSIQLKQKEKDLLVDELNEEKENQRIFSNQIRELEKTEAENQSKIESIIREKRELQQNLEISIKKEDEALSLLLEQSDEIDSLKSDLNNEINQSGDEILSKEFKLLSQKQNDLLKLWEQTTSWNRRVDIEKKSNERQLLPFTLTAAFVAFEDYISRQYKETVPYSEQVENITLNDMIFALGKQPGHSHLKNEYREIRIARNNWFHNAKPPQKGTINKLLDIIRDETPRIIPRKK